MKYFFIGCLVLLQSSSGWSQVQIGQTLFGDSTDLYFGAAIDISDSGKRIIIASQDSLQKVRTYEWSGNSWIELGSPFKTMGKSGWDFVSIAGDGNTIAMNWGDTLNDFKIRVFEWENNAWEQKGNPILPLESSIRFSSSLSLNSDGSVIIIGDEKNVENHSCGGKVQVFRFQNDDWSQVGQDIDSSSPGALLGEVVDISKDGKRIFIQARGDRNYRVLELNSPNEYWKSFGDKITDEIAAVNLSVYNSLGGNGEVLLFSGKAGNAIDSTCLVYLKYDDGAWQLAGKYCKFAPTFNAVNTFQEVSVSKDGNIVAAVYKNIEALRSIHLFRFSDGEFIPFGDSIMVGNGFGWNMRLTEDGRFLMVSGKNTVEDAGKVKVFELDFSTSISDALEGNFCYKVFPNPTSDHLNFAGDLTKVKVINIYDVLGNLIESHRGFLQPLEISHLEKGIYFLELIGEYQKENIKIVKQ